MRRKRDHFSLSLNWNVEILVENFIILTVQSLLIMHLYTNKIALNFILLTLQRGVTSTARHSVNITCRGVTVTARMLHALTHSSLSRQVRQQM